MLGRFIVALIATIICILIMAALLYLRRYGKGSACKMDTAKRLSREGEPKEKDEERQ